MSPRRLCVTLRISEGFVIDEQRAHDEIGGMKRAPLA
jgi:hypothetical protein